MAESLRLPSMYQFRSWWTRTCQHQKGGRETSPNGSSHVLPFTVKPDADNILKLIDGLNGIAWHDDAQVTEAIVHKHTRRKFGVEGTTFTVSWEQETEQ